MDKIEFRSLIANLLHQNAQVNRENIFGTFDELNYFPKNLHTDSHIMFAGYVGRHYLRGGCVLVANNPGGGSDKCIKRTPADNIFYPKLNKLKTASEHDRLSAFEDINDAFIPIVKDWNIWLVIKELLFAADYTIDQIAYLNAFPYRTRENKKVRKGIRKKAYELVTGRLIDTLQPKRIVILGKAAEKSIKDFYKGSADTYTLQRSNGDKYITKEAKIVLTRISHEFH